MQHMAEIEETFEAFQKFNMRLNPWNYTFGWLEKFVNFIVT